MKKILIVASVTGHINIFHIPYLKLFKEQGYEVHTASLGDKPIEYSDKHFNIPFARNPFKRQNFIAYKQLKNIIKQNKYEIVHCHTPVAGILTRLATKKERKRGTKVIYTAHGFHFYKGAPKLNWLIYYPIEKYASKYTDALITINKEDYEIAKKKMKAKNIYHINGVGMNTQRFDKNITEEEKNKLRLELNIDKNDIVLSYVAELNKNKNQELLISTAEKILKQGYNIKLILIGNGTLKEEYIKIIKEKKLDKNILLLGQRKDIPQLLSITDIYVASSIREGLPVNVMEAMYLQKPVIATKNRGHNELITDDKNGYLIPANCIDKFVEKIIYLINNKDKRIAMGKMGKEIVIPYTIENTLKQMTEIYMIVKGDK